MAINSEFAKKHWQAVTASLVGLIVLYYVYHTFSKGSAAPASSSTTDLSGGAPQVTALASAASLQNAQLNSQVEIASYSAQTVNNKTQAALDASLADTAAKLAAAQAATAAGVTVALGSQATAVDLQKIVSSEHVTTQSLQSEQAIQTTKIQGDTYMALADTAAQSRVAVEQAKAAVDLAHLGLETHYLDTLASQHKLGGDSTGVSQIATTILTEGQGGPSAIAANQPTMVSNSAPAIIGAVSNGAKQVFSGLFG